MEHFNSVGWSILHLLDPSNYWKSKSGPPPEDTREIPCYISPDQRALYERKTGEIVASAVPKSVLREVQQLEAKAM